MSAAEYEASVGEDDVLYGEFGELFLAPSDDDAALKTSAAEVLDDDARADAGSDMDFA